MNLTSGFSTNAIQVPYQPELSRMAVVPPITTSALFRQDEPEIYVVEIKKTAVVVLQSTESNIYKFFRITTMDDAETQQGNT